MDDLSKAYQVLGLKPGASPEEAKQTYRDLVNVWHPDRFAHDERLRSVAQDKLKEINGAYEIIKASAFDSNLASAGSAVTDAAGTPPDQTDVESNRGGARWAWGALALVGLAIAAFFVIKAVMPGSSTAPVQSATPRQFALSFKGAGHVAISTTGSLTGTFTVECWALTTERRGTETILASLGPKDCSFDIKFREGRRFHADIGDGSQWLEKMANATFHYNPNIWYHIAYVVMPGGYVVYVNGLQMEEGRMSQSGAPMLYDADHQLCLGTDTKDESNLDGCLSEVRVWKTARTAEQIKACMNLSLNGNEPGLHAYWRCDEGNGLDINDVSSHGFTGKLNGNVTWTTNAPPIVGP